MREIEVHEKRLQIIYLLLSIHITLLLYVRSVWELGQGSASEASRGCFVKPSPRTPNPP